VASCGPDVKTEITFDKDLYFKGKGNAGYFRCVKREAEHCSIDSYGMDFWGKGGTTAA